VERLGATLQGINSFQEHSACPGVACWGLFRQPQEVWMGSRWVCCAVQTAHAGEHCSSTTTLCIKAAPFTNPCQLIRCAHPPTPTITVPQLKPVLNAGLKLPEVASTTWIAPSAQVVGEVKVGDNCSIWYNCTVRGEWLVRVLLRRNGGFDCSEQGRSRSRHCVRQRWTAGGATPPCLFSPAKNPTNPHHHHHHPQATRSP